MAPEKVFEESAAATENDLVCFHFRATVLADQSDIGQLSVLEQTRKSVFCVQAEVFPHQPKLHLRELSLF